MNRFICLAALAIAAVGLTRTGYAQTAVFDFEDGTDQGFGAPFGDDASKNFAIVNIGGSMRMAVPHTGGFQEAGVATGNPSSPFYQAMLAASSNEAGYLISYDWYIDTSAFGSGQGNFLQLGTFVNTGGGYYAQNFGGTKEVEINGTQLASGQVFQGTSSQTFFAKGFDMPPAQTFFRLGLIVNGDGANQLVYYDNITISPIPNHTSLVWSGPASGDWNHSTMNFTNASTMAAAAFTDGDSVNFDDTTSGTVNLVGTLAPDAINVSSVNNFEFAGSGSIGGGALLSKSGGGMLTLSTSNSFTGAVTVTGGTLVLNNAGALGATTAVNVGGGATLASNVSLSIASFDIQFGNAMVTVAANQTVTITGALTGYNNILKTGPGTLTLAGSDQHSGTTTVSNGTLNINTPTRQLTSGLVVAGAGHVNLGAPASSTSYVMAAEYTDIFVDSDLSVTVPPVDRSVNKPVVVLVDNTASGFGGSISGLLDLGNSDLIVRNGDVGVLRGLVSSWYNGGSRDGTSGIGSTANSNAFTTLAVFPNNALATGYFTNYDGIAIAGADVIVKFTYVGDVNLDGVVNGVDLADVIESLSVGGLTGWENGDVNYDGVIDATDVALTQSALLANLPSLGNGQGGSGNGGSVPEPTAIAMVLAGLPMLGRRRRA